jgi:hypothetical protein
MIGYPPSRYRASTNFPGLAIAAKQMSHERHHAKQTGTKQEHAQSRDRANDVMRKAETSWGRLASTAALIHTSLAKWGGHHQ